MRLLSDTERTSLKNRAVAIANEMRPLLKNQYESIDSVECVVGPISAELRITFNDCKTLFSIHSFNLDKDELLTAVENAMQQKDRYTTAQLAETP